MDETVVTRTMPNSPEAEQSVIGSMMMDNDAIASAMEILVREDFYHTRFALMFQSIVELYNEGQPVDVVTVQQRLLQKNAPAEIASQQYITDVALSVPSSVNVKSYAQIVKDKALLRNVIHVNQEIEKECFEQNEPVATILDQTEKKMLEIIQSRGVENFEPIDQVVSRALDKIEAASHLSGNVTGVPTGFIDLDYRTAGLQPSDLILLAARPSMGKTALALNIAEHVAFHEHMCVAIFSLEMSKEQLVNRLLSLESRVDAQKLRTGDLQDSDWEKLIEGAATVSSSKLIIDDTPAITVSQMRSKCRKYKQEHDLKLIMVDYLQLMETTGKEVSQQQKISDISRSLKSLARELNVPLIALSQLNRGVEQREDKRPMLSDLRDSGAIEQDADIVMFIYRDDYYNKDSPSKGVSEIIIAKQRNGPVGTVNLAWLPEYTKFANYERRRE
ncbi:MAG: replicative DNA helicase [Lachnospiraceae bacterium]|nr:replicative DNA helicase [Lachnospiraceae bacterium]